MMHLRQVAVFIGLVVSMVDLYSKPPQLTEKQVAVIANLNEKINDFISLEKTLNSYERTAQNFQELKEATCLFFDSVYSLNGYPAEWVSKHKHLSLDMLISKHNDTLMANKSIRPTWESFKECAALFVEYEKEVKRFLALFYN